MSRLAYEKVIAGHQGGARGRNVGFWLTFFFCSLLTLCSLYLTMLLAEGLWRPPEILSIYSAFDDAVNLMGHFIDPGSAPLVVFTFNIPIPGHALLGGLVAVSLLNLANIYMVMQIGSKLYGPRSGLIAGIVFSLGIALVLGYFQLTEPLALLLILSATYLLLCMPGRHAHVLSGLCIGASICLKPYAVLLLPITLLTMRRVGHGQDWKAFIAGALLPPAILFFTLFALHGSDVVSMARCSSLEVVGIYLAGGSYRMSDRFLAMTNVIMSACLIVSPLPLALLSLSGRPRHTHDWFFLLAGASFIATLIVGEYTYYWYLALPFIALLCASNFDPGVRPTLPNPE